MDIGIPASERAEVVSHLSRLLADTYTLYLKTHNFHWNVTGPRFNDLHAMFMTQYTAMWMAVDAVAERVRALGAKAPGSYREFAALTVIPEASGTLSAAEMVQQLVEGHEAVCRTARAAFPAAEAAHDQVTLDLLTQRLNFHETTAWMLRTLAE
jgi:starvation-inducible DNA-binding protein